jgi:hypothetical protein
MNEGPRNPDLHQEEDRLPWPIILLVALVMVLLGALLVIWAWYGLKRREHVLRPTGVFPEKELRARHPVEEELEDIFAAQGRGQVLNERKRRDISTFQWVDRRRGIVAIPIEDAVTLVVEERRR